MGDGCGGDERVWDLGKCRDGIGLGLAWGGGWICAVCDYCLVCLCVHARACACMCVCVYVYITLYNISGFRERKEPES